MTKKKNLPEAVVSRVFFFFFCSSDTLWDLAADEVRVRERRTGHDQDGDDDDDDENEEDSHAPSERTVFFMGSKTGVKKILSTLIQVITGFGMFLYHIYIFYLISFMLFFFFLISG